MPKQEPATLIARWNTPNPQTTVPILARSLSSNLSATSLGRFLVHTRTLRLPPPAQSTSKGKNKVKIEGRNMYMIRKVEGDVEENAIIVEDPNKPPRPLESNGKGKAVDRDESGSDGGHYRWTYATVAPPHFSSSASSSSSIDSFIGRVLVTPPAASSASNPQTTPTWQTRPTTISLEGGTFSVSSNPIASPTNTDWLIKVAVVNLKGGTASGTTRGCIVQATYLPIPYLPPSSPLIRNFLHSLFPTQAVQNGEITLLDTPESELASAGILDRVDERDGASEEGEGEWEWKDKHSLFSYIQQFRKEGLL
ncbi:uncharacterized protein JCM6883_006908 [Sporobolomyces salmoneus]|uniref:uncharacterized protein n=1 Tax=Sporobolomyces salmoneus TaxID=183962 RepID=UPI00317912C1